MLKGFSQQPAFVQRLHSSCWLRTVDNVSRRTPLIRSGSSLINCKNALVKAENNYAQKISLRHGQRLLSSGQILSNDHRRWMSTETVESKPTFREKAQSQFSKYFGYIKPKRVTTSSRSALKVLSPEGEVVHFRERFIPITRRSIIRHLMQEEGVLTDAEREVFEKFALSIDGALANRYHGSLEELKSLFDPINPDKDTIATRQWNQKERLDNEFWLLQKLGNVLVRANFHELPKAVVEKAISEHCAGEGIMVSVNPTKYDVMRFWALGRECPEQNLPWYKLLFYKVFRRPLPLPLEYYKRIITAVRLKTDTKLMLKAYKDIPVNALEQLLPDGKIRMTHLDQSILTATFSIGIIGILAKLISTLAEYDIQWTLILTAVCGLVGVRGWTVYKNRKNKYLVDLSRMLYFKNIANNRSLLTLLVDRAEDETFKEAILTYTFLLKNRPPSNLEKESVEQSAEDLGGISSSQLERQIEDWIFNLSGSTVEFDCNESVSLLQSFGILSIIKDRLHVLPIDVAMRHLPQQPESVITRGAINVDDIEGFDRDTYNETEKVIKKQDKIDKKFGWK